MNMAPATGNYLCINCGSSSLKFSLYQAGSLALMLSGQISRIGQLDSGFQVKDKSGTTQLAHSAPYMNFEAAAGALIAWLSERSSQYLLIAIGHRLVQGGPDHRMPERITPLLLNDLQRYSYLAPNHLPDALTTIGSFQSAYPNAVQVACFDTAFHRDMPAVARDYPLPASYCNKGLFKYGFHGLSYTYVLQELMTRNPRAAAQKVIIAHLGNGASMAAISQGRSIDTTMGVSPIGGLVMGTRCGDLDPGVILFLMNRYGMNAAQLEELLSKQSGLKAIAGSSDVQELLKRAAESPEAEAALLAFCYSCKKHIGSLAAILEGLDTLVFTGGIGENSAVIRERICRGLNFLGIELDQQKNQAGEYIISAKTSRVAVCVIQTNEELMMARQIHNALNNIKP